MLGFRLLDSKNNILKVTIKIVGLISRGSRKGEGVEVGVCSCVYVYFMTEAGVLSE